MRRSRFIRWSAFCLWAALLSPVATGQAHAEDASADDAAQTSLAYSPPEWPQAPDTVAMLRRLGMGTASVLAFSAAALWAAKRWLKGAAGTPGSGGHLQVLETMPVGHRCSVVLVSVGQQRFLAGLDPTGLKSLVLIPEPFALTLDRTQATDVGEDAVQPKAAA